MDKQFAKIKSDLNKNSRLHVNGKFYAGEFEVAKCETSREEQCSQSDFL